MHCARNRDEDEFELELEFEDEDEYEDEDEDEDENEMEKNCHIECPDSYRDRGTRNCIEMQSKTNCPFTNKSCIKIEQF